MNSKNNIINNNKTEEEDDVMPELEDLSEELGKIRQKLNKDSESDSSEIKINVISNKILNSNLQNSHRKSIIIPISSGSPNTTPTSNPTPHPILNTTPTISNLTSNAPQKQEELIGFRFKKGFFLRNPELSNTNGNNNTNNDNYNKKAFQQKKKVEEPSNKVIDLTHLKPRGESVKDKFITQIKTEVKENSNDLNKSLNYIQDKKDEWCNSNLLSAMAQKPSLMKFFMDPRFAEAIQLMQKDPKNFMQTYGKNPEFNEFIKEFSSIMATHFNNIGEEKQAEQPPMNKEVEKIINEPKVKTVIERLQREGKLDVNEIQRDPELSMKIKLLIDIGFLKLQRE